MSAIGSNGRAGRARRAATSTVGAALCAGLLAGCGGGSSKAAHPAAAPTTLVAPLPALPTDLPQKAACGLVTAAEVEAAIGAKVGAGKEEAKEGRSLCTFAVTGSPDQSVVLFSTTSSGVPAFFAASRAKATGAQPVAGGEEAFVNGPQALVRKGNTMVAILAVLRQTPAQLTSAATRLAQAVGARI